MLENNLLGDEFIVVKSPFGGVSGGDMPNNEFNSTEQSKHTGIEQLGRETAPTFLGTERDTAGELVRDSSDMLRPSIQGQSKIFDLRQSHDSSTVSKTMESKHPSTAIYAHRVTHEAGKLKNNHMSNLASAPHFSTVLTTQKTTFRHPYNSTTGFNSRMSVKPTQLPTPSHGHHYHSLNSHSSSQQFRAILKNNRRHFAVKMNPDNVVECRCGKRTRQVNSSDGGQSGLCNLCIAI